MFTSESLYLKKSRIRETPTLSTDADSRTDTILERLRDLSLYKKKAFHPPDQFLIFRALQVGQRVHQSTSHAWRIHDSAHWADSVKNYERYSQYTFIYIHWGSLENVWTNWWTFGCVLDFNPQRPRAGANWEAF